MSLSNKDRQEQLATCPKCGKTAPLNARFCGFDGTALSDSIAKQCPKCSTSYPTYASFCPHDASQLILGESKGQQKSAELVQGWGAKLVGQTINDKYRIEQFIGEGGMAVVYRANQLNIDRPVVIKILHWQLQDNERAIERFERETQFTAKVNHPNVVSVFDAGILPSGQPYLVMEYIEGESLRGKLDREKLLGLDTACLILSQICRGLNEAHNAGLIHRDLKPENILIKSDPERPDWIKIVDFGIAHLVVGYQKLTHTGHITGTAAYMAPEQLRDTEVDVRADLYALGILFYEMLTGEPPFAGETAAAIILKQLVEKAPRPSSLRTDITPGSVLDRIVGKLLEKDPANRYQNANELRLAVEHCFKSERN